MRLAIIINLDQSRGVLMFFWGYTLYACSVLMYSHWRTCTPNIWWCYCIPHSRLADANNKVIELNQEDRVVPVGTIRSSGAVVLKELDADDEITWFVNNVSKVIAYQVIMIKTLSFFLFALCYTLQIFSSSKQFVLKLILLLFVLIWLLFVCFMTTNIVIRIWINNIQLPGNT